MLKVVVLTVTSELSINDFDILLSLVDSCKKKRLKQFHFFQDARNCLLGDVLSRLLICSNTGLSNKQLQFFSDAYGKPFLTNNPFMHFNISHAGHYIACAVSDKPVGIDIELIRTVDMAIVERFFTPDEKAYVISDELERCFCEIWTKKESRTKFDGVGLHKPLPSFDVLENKEHLIYHKIFESIDAIGHVCTTINTLPTVIMTDSISFLRYVNCPETRALLW